VISVCRSLLKNADALVISIAMVSWRFLTGTPPTSRTVATLLGIYVVLDLARKIREHTPAAGTGRRKRQSGFLWAMPKLS
jgi:hypothetical protein